MEIIKSLRTDSWAFAMFEVREEESVKKTEGQPVM